MTRTIDTVRVAVPGLLLSATIALAVRFVSDQLGGPAMLYALLFGMAFNFLTEDERFAAGIYFASRNILRFGVALLGLRITTGDVMELGWSTVALIVAAVIATILIGGLIGRAFGLKGNQSVLSAGAVAICGASAALAIASVLPAHKDHERNTIMTVAGVTALSTVAMVVYPVFVTYLQYDDATAGVFLGATIHDVAQVVGAGFSISEDVGNIASLTKLLRVACLIPVLGFIIYVRKTVYKNYDKNNKVALPWFVVAFALLVVVNSLQILPEGLVATLVEFSRWLLVVGIAAIGIKTSPSALFKVGGAAALLLVGEAIFLATLVALLLSML